MEIGLINILIYKKLRVGFKPRGVLFLHCLSEQIVILLNKLRVSKIFNIVLITER